MVNLCLLYNISLIYFLKIDLEFFIITDFNITFIFKTLNS